MEYWVSRRWYVFQFSAALPLALLAVIFFLKRSATGLVFITAIVFLIYVFIIAYRVYKQKQIPIITTDNEGILISEYGFKPKKIKWNEIYAATTHFRAIKLTVLGQVEKLPSNALNLQDQEMLYKEITARIAQHTD